MGEFRLNLFVVTLASALTVLSVPAAPFGADIAADDLSAVSDFERPVGEPLVWVRDGKSLLPIVTDTRRIECVRAAEFLRDVVEAMTGVRPAVVAQAEGKAVRIAPPVRDSGAFTVKVGADGVTLAGYGPFAAYDFAERVLGARQYFDPKKGGLSVVKTDEIVLAPLVYSDAPVYTMRRIHPFSFTGGSCPWMAPWRVGDELHVPHQVHAPQKWFKDTNENYRVTRPEIFERKADGRRALTPMLCYSNPKTLETYLERIDRELAGGPKAGDIFSAKDRTITISQWDSGLACTCADCLRLRTDKLGENGTYSPVMWNHFVTKFSDVAKAKYPDFTLSVLPYHNTCTLPPGLQFTNGNVVAYLVTHPGLAMFKDPSIKADEEAKIRDWAKATGRKVVNWHYLCYPQCFTSLPILFGRAAVDHYKVMRESVAGTFIDSYAAGNGRELSTYVWFKALWNPDFDVEKVYDAFARRMFGPAAKEMREFIRMQEAGWNRPWKVAMCSNKNIFERSFPRQDVLKMLALAETSRKQLRGDELGLKRLAFYLDPFKQFFRESEEYASGSAFTPLEMMKAFDAPKIDGKLDDECWKKAKAVETVEGLDRNRKAPSVKTEVRVVWTADGGVTFGVKCHEPQMDKVTRTAPPISWNETLEFFFDPSGQAEGGFFQIAVDISGAIRGWHSGKNDWKDARIRHAVAEGPDFWSVELYVPFDAVKDFPGAQIPTTAAGDRFWIGNVSRMRFGPPKAENRPYEVHRLFTRFSKWNKDPAAFGKFKFKEW